MRKNILFTLLALFGLSIVSYGQSKGIKSKQTKYDCTVVVASDLHFDLLPETDQYYHVVAINNLENHFRFPSTAPKGIAGTLLKKLDCVALAGDLFDKSRPEILGLYRQRYEMGKGERRIHYNVFPGLGNHDINPAVSDKGADNLKGRAYTFHYLDSVLNAKLKRGEILNLDASSRSYSWNVGGVHFVNGQCCAGDTSYCKSNFEWLEKDLKKYASHGAPVIYIQHFGVDKETLDWWPESSRVRLFGLLDKYNLAAFFAGHAHIATLEIYKGHTVYQVNNAWKDSDGPGSFVVLRIKGNVVSAINCKVLDGKGTFEVAEPSINKVLPRWKTDK